MNAVVVTMFGQDENPATEIVVSQFDNGADASHYISLWDNADLGNGKWSQCVFAENFKKYSTFKKKVFSFHEIVEDLTDTEIQQVMRQIDHGEMCLILKDEPSEIMEKFFRNMSKRAAGMLKEDMNSPAFSRGSKELMVRNFLRIVETLKDNGDIF